MMPFHLVADVGRGTYPTTDAQNLFMLAATGLKGRGIPAQGK